MVLIVYRETEKQIKIHGEIMYGGGTIREASGRAEEFVYTSVLQLIVHFSKSMSQTRPLSRVLCLQQDVFLW